MVECFCCVIKMICSVVTKFQLISKLFHWTQLKTLTIISGLYSKSQIRRPAWSRYSIFVIVFLFFLFRPSWMPFCWNLGPHTVWKFLSCYFFYLQSCTTLHACSASYPVVWPMVEESDSQHQSLYASLRFGKAVQSDFFRDHHLHPTCESWQNTAIEQFTLIFLWNPFLDKLIMIFMESQVSWSKSPLYFFESQIHRFRYPEIFFLFLYNFFSKQPLQIFSTRFANPIFSEVERWTPFL